MISVLKAAQSTKHYNSYCWALSQWSLWLDGCDHGRRLDRGRVACSRAGTLHVHILASCDGECRYRCDGGRIHRDVPRLEVDSVDTLHVGSFHDLFRVLALMA
jgi:hypothetical protein